MVNFQYEHLFKKDSVDKQIQIAFDGGTITNTELHQGQFELNESLCSEEQLRFGSCEASSIKFKISNIFTPLTGKWLTVTETLDGNTDVSFSYGKYKVSSDKPTADRRYREVTAYDAMYDILTTDVTAWYNTILPDADSTVTLKEFRDSFLAYFGIEQEEVKLINDDMTVEKTVEPSQMSGKTVITAICEINGCFGHIGRDGRFQYIHLKEMVEGLYPSNTLYPRDDLYPADPMNAEQIKKSHYIEAEYEDFTTERINKLLIRKEENDIGANYPEGNITDTDNCYIVQDNFLVYGKSTEELTQIAKKMYSVICRVWYRPAHVEAKGNPCLEVGDGIRLSTKYAIVYTYILQRTLKGIQAIRDTYDADGEQYQSEKVNSVRESIIQLKGKTNTLTRTIEETRLEISDIEKGLSTKIQQNADAILLEAKRATEAEGTLSASIKVEADRITSEVKRATEAEGNLSSRITQTAESITAEVTRATEAEGNLSAQVSINAQQILLKVSKDGIISSINQTAEQIKIQAQKIDLVGLVNADEFVSKFATITTLEASNARISNLEVDHVSIEDFNAATARIGTLETGKIDADTVYADFMEVSNWTSAGYIKASKIDVDSLFAKTSIESTIAYFNGLHVAKLWDSTGMGLKTCWKYDSALGWYISGIQSS